VIGGGGLKKYHGKMEAIMRREVPTNVYEMKSFIGKA